MSAGPVHLYWDTCVFVRYITGKPNDGYLPQIRTHVADAMNGQGFRQGAVNGVAGVQAGIGVLKHHLHLRRERLATRGGHRLATDLDAATRHRGKAANGAQDGGFA